MNVVALAGGVGGAKLADGLYRVLPPDTLTVIGNTADDLDLFGVHISPDLDTVMYTLAGLANPATGWGVAGDTFATLAMLERYGEEAWFRLGDADFATHLKRTAALRAGRRLTEATAELTRPLGIRARLLPMCDETVATEVETPDGWRDFQDYFVRRRHEERVTAVRFAGIARARVTAEVSAALAGAGAIVFCPSNPLVSIGPILACRACAMRSSRARRPKSPSHRSSAGRRSRAPPTGCWPRRGWRSPPMASRPATSACSMR